MKFVFFIGTPAMFKPCIVGLFIMNTLIYKELITMRLIYRGSTDKAIMLMPLSIASPSSVQWWLFIMIMLVIIVITILVVSKIQQVKYLNIIRIKDTDRQCAVEKERERIARDMHDEIGASMTRISILSELARQQQDEPAKAQQLIHQISELSRGVVDEMREIIWAMNPHNDTLDNFASYNRQYASSYLDSAGIRGKFNFPQEIPLCHMPSELRRNLFLTVKEALNNVVKHSGASNVCLQLNFRDQILQMVISDDGKGFENEKGRNPGHGLLNMQKHMEESKGCFELTTAAGAGTKIGLSVKLPVND